MAENASLAAVFVAMIKCHPDPICKLVREEEEEEEKSKLDINNGNFIFPTVVFVRPQKWLRKHVLVTQKRSQIRQSSDEGSSKGCDVGQPNPQPFGWLRNGLVWIRFPGCLWTKLLRHSKLLFKTSGKSPNVTKGAPPPRNQKGICFNIQLL